VRGGPAWRGHAGSSLTHPALRCARAPARPRAALRDSTLGRLRRYVRCGPWAGPIFAAVAVADALYMRWVALTQPAHSIDVAPELPPPGPLRARPPLPPPAAAATCT
jgi:hypothetical protein